MTKRFSFIEEKELKNRIMNEEKLKQGYKYLVRIKDPFDDHKFRFATFNGFGQNHGWSDMDWSGDSGHSTDSWMHDEVTSFVAIENLAEIINIGLLTKKSLM